MKTVKAIVDHLPADVFEEAPPSPPYISSHDSFDSLSDPHVSIPPAGSREAARNNIIREMVETERKYVQDLEIMQVRLNRNAYSLPTDFSFSSEIFYSPLTEQHHRPGYYTSSISRP